VRWGLCSQTFLKEPKQVLWLALAGRSSGTRPSQLAEIDDPIAALDFDLACAFRLEIYDADCRKAQAKLNVIEISKWWSGDTSDNDSEFD
jgi:hypothetical protein